MGLVMAGKFLIGVAAASLFAFGGTAAANAADVMPVIVPAPVGVVTVAAGPTIEITTEHWLEFNFEPGDDVDPSTFHSIDLKVTGLRGLGFQLTNNLYVDIDTNPLAIDEIEGDATGRVFLSRGAFEIGAYTTMFFDNGFDELAVGTDFTVDLARFTLSGYIQAIFEDDFDFTEFEFGGDVTTHILGDRLELAAGFEGDTWGAVEIETVWLGAQFHLGPIAPYVTFTWDDGDRLLAIGTEFEQKLGNSNFSLLAYGEVEIELGDPAEYNFGIGFKWATGGE
jgi:hypothetical protein